LKVERAIFVKKRAILLANVPKRALAAVEVGVIVTNVDNPVTEVLTAQMR